jgi:hypothetical protein
MYYWVGVLLGYAVAIGFTVGVALDPQIWLIETLAVFVFAVAGAVRGGTCDMGAALSLVAALPLPTAEAFALDEPRAGAALVLAWLLALALARQTPVVEPDDVPLDSPA